MSPEMVLDILVYMNIGIMMAAIGLCTGYLVMRWYYARRFLDVARQCEAADSIAPLLSDLERES